MNTISNYLINIASYYVMPIRDFIQNKWQNPYPCEHSQTENLFDNLPNEMTEEILLNLKPKDLLSLSKTSHKMSNWIIENSLWDKLAKKKELHIEPGLSPLAEFQILSHIGKSSKLAYKIAKALGPSRMQNLMETWQKRKLSNKTPIKAPLIYTNFKNMALVINCQTVDSKTKFQMKILQNKEPNLVTVSCSFLSTIPSYTEIKFKNDKRVEIEQFKFDYLTKLASGQVCNILHEGQWELPIPIQLDEVGFSGC